MTGENLLLMAGFLTLCNAGLALVMGLIAGQILLGWVRHMQATKEALPKMLQDAMNELAATVVEPYREFVNEHGRSVAVPNSPVKDEIVLDEDFTGWMARP